jgi:DNA-binding transcriptional LysR family regulator
MSFARGAVPNAQWPIPSGGRFHVDGALFSNDLHLMLEAALQGCGIAVLPEPIAAAFVARGDLVQVLPGAVGSHVRISVVYAERAFVPAPVRVFIDAMVAWGATGLFESTPDYAVRAPPRKARRRKARRRPR